MKGHISNFVPQEFYTEPKTYNDLFLEAIRTKDVDTVKSMLLAGTVDVNATNRDGFTPIYFAIAYRGFTVAKILLEHGADPNHRFHIGGITPLFFALSSDDAEMFKILAEGGGDIFAVDNYGNNLAHYCAYKGSIPQDLFAYLYERGFDFTTANADNANIMAIAAYAHVCNQSHRMRNDKRFLTFVALARHQVMLNTDIHDCPLFSLKKLGVWSADMQEDYSPAVTGSFHGLASFLLLASTIPSLQLAHTTVADLVKLGLRVPAEDEELLLSLIVSSGSARAVANYIAAGGDPFRPLAHGYTSICLAVMCGQYQLVDALCKLCEGLAQKQQLVFNERLGRAVQFLHRHHDMTPLLAAFVAEENVLKLFDTLSHYGYDLSKRHDRDLKGLTPLTYALASGNWAAVSCLLELGVDPNVRVPVSAVIDLLREEEDNTEDMMVPLRHLALAADIYPLELALIMAADEHEIVAALLNAGARWRKDVRGQDIVSFIDQYAPDSSECVRVSEVFYKTYIEKSFMDRVKKDVDENESRLEKMLKAPTDPNMRLFSTLQTPRMSTVSTAAVATCMRRAVSVVSHNDGYAPVMKRNATLGLQRALHLIKYL